MRALLGLRGQGMDGRRRAAPVLVGTIIQGRAANPVADLTGSYMALENLTVDLFAYAAGASGSAESALRFGGGGGSAGYSRLTLTRGSVLSWSIGWAGRTVGPVSGAGEDGRDLTVSINDVLHGTAQGGRRPNAAAAARSTATGFQVNRYGGGSGERGEFGVAVTGGVISGGSSGGFSDMFGDYSSGRGNTTLSNPPLVADYGGGGVAGHDTNYSNYGGQGLLVALLYRAFDR